MSRGSPQLPDPDERRRLFRKMEWVFVYGPPLLILFIGVFGAAFLAWAVDVPRLGFWGEWAAGVGLIIGVPLIAYAIRSRWSR